ncbi:FkbM family methyltransferase [Sinorhizobium meliloti]|nr:FkbM family methyltransferase [Sinorhizobium meliloti]
MTVGRKVYLDLGANVGDTIAHFAEWHPSHLIWGFEANPQIVRSLRKRFKGNPNVKIVHRAVWVSEGTITLFLGHPLSSTVMEGKVAMPQAPEFEIHYDQSVEVTSIDFANWLLKNFTLQDDVTIKMDIEGAEYPILRRMIETKAIKLVDLLICEFHHNRFPSEAEDHDRLLATLSEKTRLIRWH